MMLVAIRFFLIFLLLAVSADGQTIGSGGSGSCALANPTGLAGPVAVNGSATTCLRSDAAPAVQLATGSQPGLQQPDNITEVVNAGIGSVSDTVETARSSPVTFAAGDMGKLIPLNAGASGITVPASGIGLTIFAAGQTSCVENNTGSSVSLTNSSGVTIFPAFTNVNPNETLCLTGDGSNLFGQLGVAPAINVARGGTGLNTLTSNAIYKGNGTGPIQVSNLADSGTLVSAAVATVSTPVALTDGATIAVNAALSDNFTLTLTGSHTLLNPTNMTAGQNLTFQITQDGTGGRAITWGGNFSWMSGAPPLLNSAAAAVTFISCKVLSSVSLYCAGGAPVPAYQTFTCAVPHTTSTGASTLTCFWKAARAFTVDNVTATVVGTFTTVTATLFECGTSTTCASSPVTMTTGAVTTANTATPLTVASPTINTGDYIAIELTAGTVTAIDVNVQAVMH